MLWQCADCGFTITDLERRMAGGPMPRRVFDMGRELARLQAARTMDGGRGIVTPIFEARLQHFGCGATNMAPTRVRDSDQWVRPSAGIEWSETPSPTVSPSGSAECDPANIIQDTAELRAIRAAAKGKQTAAEIRARALLVEVIGEPAVQTLEAGGTYAVPSRRWPGTEYHIPKQGYLKIVRDGLWQEVCLVSSDQGLPWADVVLSRIKMLEAHETIVQGRGNRQGGSPNRRLDQLKAALEKLVNPRRGL